MKRLLIYLIGLLFVSTVAISQEIPVPEKLKTIPNAKCYWGYSVERLNTEHDSIHKYTIRVSVQQVDSSGNNKGRLRLKHAIIYCSFIEEGIPKKIFFKQVGLKWIAKFRIHTNELLPLKIIAKYNNQKRIMPLKLNEGTYPGESEN